MKIVCLTHYYIEDNRAGGEMMIHGILKYLVAQGHDVTALITNNCRLNTVIDGVKVIYAVDKLRVLDTYDYDLVISQFDNSLIAIQHAHKNGKLVSLAVHNDHPATQQLVGMLDKRDLAIFNTEWISNKIKTRAKKVVVHPPIEIVKQDKTEDRKYVTIVNLVREKGADIFYQIARSMPSVLFMGVKGGYWKDRQNIQPCVNVLIQENTDNMYRDVYSKSKIVLMPSTYESYGMVAAEAISYGIPVICSPQTGLKENLGESGIYINPTDIPSWVDSIRRLLSEPDYYNSQSKLCKDRAKSKNFEEELKKLSEMVASL